MIVIEQLGLRQDPFGPASSATGFGVAPSLRVARDRILDAVHRGDPLTVLAGRPGMGKTLLLGLVEQACRADGIEVRTVARGDMAHTALGSGAELLLIDEADTINAATLTALAPGTAAAAAPMMIFAAAQPALHRISSDVRTTIVELRPLDPSEARDFLLARAIQAGRPDLFSPEALDIIVEAGRGSPRLLRVLAGAAMFQAMSDGVSRITADHAGLAAAMQGSLFGRPPAEAALPIPANDLGPRVDADDRPRPVVPPRLRPMQRGSAAGLAFAASVALVALVLPVFSLPEPTGTTSMAVSTASAAQAAPGAAHAAAFAPAPGMAPLTAGSLVGPRATLAPEVSLRRAALTVPPLLAAPAPRILMAARDAGVARLEARIAADPGTVARTVADFARAEAGAAASADRALLIDVLAATRMRPGAVANRTAEDAQEPASVGAALAAAALPVPPEPLRGPALAMTELGAVWRAVTTASDTARSSLDAAIEPMGLADLGAQPFAALKAAAETARSVKGAAVATVRDTAGVAKLAADESRAAKLAAEQAKDSAGQARAAKQAADQAKAAKEAAEQAKAAKDAADQAKAAKDAADQAKAAKDAADQAKSAKDAADQAKAAKDAADQAKAAKEAADQAKAAKDAADQAKAAKDAADQAKAAKDAADQAKAAKDAADQAKAAKDAADQAKAAKDAADQAKAAKDAADQAKAAKDAADQAKAAKDAADQAKAAKDAADQAKAAKDAADQAKAAKDAADQAKAAKDAADQAKAAKDAADQAKAAREAADAAKDAAKAAKDAAKAAKDAAKAGKS